MQNLKEETNLEGEELQAGGSSQRAWVPGSEAVVGQIDALQAAQVGPPRQALHGTGEAE